MKLAEARPYAEPEAAGRKLLELAAGVEAINGRIHIEKINGPFSLQDRMQCERTRVWRGH